MSKKILYSVEKVYFFTLYILLSKIFLLLYFYFFVSIDSTKISNEILRRKFHTEEKSFSNNITRKNHLFF